MGSCTTAPVVGLGFRDSTWIMQNQMERKGTMTWNLRACRRERERERERKTERPEHIFIDIYIYMYIHTVMRMLVPTQNEEPVTATTSSNS